MRTQSVKFDFNDIGDNPSRAQISDSCKTLSFYLRVDDTALLRGSLRAIPAEIIDLIDVAVAVHLADRLTHRAGDYIYDIDVVLPLHCPDKFNGRLLLPDLEDILDWLTDDHWHFQFTQRKSAGRQMRMSLD